MNVKFKLLNKEYEMTPFECVYNGVDDYRLIDWAQIGDPPGQPIYTPQYFPYDAFASEFIGAGNYIDLREELRDYMEQVYKAHIPTSETFTLCEIVGTREEVDYNYNVEMTVSYNPQGASDPVKVLNVNLTGHRLQNVNGSIVDDVRTKTINIFYGYNEQPTYDEKICIIDLYLINVPVNYLAYEGTHHLFIGAPNICDNVGYKWEIDPTSQTIINLALEWNSKPLGECENSKPEGNESYLTPIGPQPYVWNAMLYNHHGRPNLSYLSPFFSSIGYTSICTADFTVKINGIEYTDEQENNDSQNNFVPNNTYSKKAFIEKSDYIPSDGVPINDILSTGFVHAYKVTPYSLTQLSNFLLTDDFLQNVKNLMQKPIDYILSLVSLPVDPPAGELENIKIGGVTSQVTGNKLSSNFYEFDCGSIKCEELWGGFMDYAPVTRVFCYVPFCGIQELNCDDIMDGSLNIKYRMDVLTGTFNCSIIVNNSRKTNGILYTYEGSVGYNIPLFASDVTSKLNALKNTVAGFVSVAGGNMGAVPGTIMSMVEASLSKPNVTRSGNLSGDSGFLGNYTPYLIIERPVQALPELYAKQKGYATRASGKLNSFKGYLEIDTIDLTGLNCTDDEKIEILNDLQGGVFV